jgi:hypothetical protein
MNKLIPRRAPAGRHVAALAGLVTMAAASLAMAAPAGAAPVHPLPPAGHKAASTTLVFNFTGAEQTFAVPAGVTSINVTAIGAAGGSGAAPVLGGLAGAGGEGEQVSGTLAVIPGNTLFVEVGGVGVAGTTSAGGAGGFNGGAAAGGTNTGGGGGGGASDVRTVSGSLVSRLIVAGGGGGGGGGGSCNTAPGGAGGSAATAGAAGTLCTPQAGGAGGGAGTALAGGAGGAGGLGTTAGGNGTPGTLGTGGAGAADGSGGGGGGLYGGGGGGGGAAATTVTWGSGGGGGGGSSFATTDLGATVSAAQVSITYTAPGPPPPAGSSDLKVFLKHQGVFQHHRLGTYGIWVTNTGTGATTVAHPMVVDLGTQSGIKVVQGGRGTAWQCQKAGTSTQCTRSAPLGAGKRTMITVTVWVNAKAGKTRHAIATVSPRDKTPADNTSFDQAIIRKH